MEVELPLAGCGFSGLWWGATSTVAVTDRLLGHGQLGRGEKRENNRTNNKDHRPVMVFKDNPR